MDLKEVRFLLFRNDKSIPALLPPPYLRPTYYMSTISKHTLCQIA